MRGTGGPGSGTGGYSEIAEKYVAIKDEFDTDRDTQYERQRIALVRRLEALIAETDEEFSSQVADMGEERDLELVRVHNLQEYRMQYAQEEYDSRMSQIDERDEMAAKDIHQRLIRRLELRADTLDKNPNLDISAPVNISTSVSGGAVGGRGGGGGSRSRLRRRENNPSGSVSATEIGGMTANEEYRSIFSDFGDLGAVSSGYTSAAQLEGVGDGEASSRSGRPARNTDATSSLTKQSTNKQPKLNGLKSEEIEQDLLAMWR